MKSKKYTCKHYTAKQIVAYANANCSAQVANNTAAYQANKPAKQAAKSTFHLQAAKNIKRIAKVYKIKKVQDTKKLKVTKATVVKNATSHFAQSVFTANKERASLDLPPLSDAESQTYYKTYMNNLCKAVLAAQAVLEYERNMQAQQYCLPLAA